MCGSPAYKYLKKNNTLPTARSHSGTNLKQDHLWKQISCVYYFKMVINESYKVFFLWRYDCIGSCELPVWFITALKTKCSPGGLLAPSWVSRLPKARLSPHVSPFWVGRAGSWARGEREPAASLLPPGWEVDPQIGRLKPADSWRLPNEILCCISQPIGDYTAAGKWSSSDPPHM